MVCAVCLANSELSGFIVTPAPQLPIVVDGASMIGADGHLRAVGHVDGHGAARGSAVVVDRAELFFDVFSPAVYFTRIAVERAGVCSTEIWTLQVSRREVVHLGRAVATGRSTLTVGRGSHAVDVTSGRIRAPMPATDAD